MPSSNASVPLKSSTNTSTQNRHYGSVASKNGKRIQPPMIDNNETYSLIGLSLEQIKARNSNISLFDATIANISKGDASSWSISFNIIKAIVGCGILSLPWATANIGLLPTFILLFVSLIISFLCWMYLIICSDHLGVYQFRDIALRLYGNRVALFIDLILIILSMMYCILYSVYIGDFISNGLNEYGIHISEEPIIDLNIETFSDFISTKFFIITLIIFFICMPLTLLPRLDSLKYSSIIGMTATTITVLYITYSFFSIGTINNNVNWVNTHDGSGTTILFWLESFGVFSAVFFGHFNTAPLYGELKHKSIKKMRHITMITFVIISILNLFIIITAYLSFGNGVNQNVIESLVSNNETRTIIALLRILMSLNMIGSYPLLFWNIKISMKNLLFFRPSGRRRAYTSNVTERFTYFVVNALIWLIAIFAAHVGEILSLIQGTVGNAIIFVFPPMFYYSLLKRQSRLTRKITILCFCIIGFGIFAMIGGIISTVMNMAGII